MKKITSKWKEIEIFYKGMVVTTFYSMIALLVSMILLVVNNTFIYGTLLGIGSLYFAYLVIWLLIFKIPTKEKLNTIFVSVIAPLIRVGFFTIILLITALVLNGSQQGLERFLYPANAFSLLFTYTIPLASYFTVMIIDFINNK